MNARMRPTPKSGLFAATLMAGGPSYVVERGPHSVFLHRVAGHDRAFDEIARRVMAREEFATFPKMDADLRCVRLEVFSLGPDLGGPAP